MAYFLGNKQYGNFKPLVLLDENDEKIPDKLLDVLRFTTNFSSEDDLKEYLLRKNLIDNFSVELCYLISKGNKDNRRYEIIRLGEHVYLADTAKFLSVPYIEQYIKNHKYVEGFMDRLYSFYLKKFGILSMATKKFKNIAVDYEEMQQLIEKMLNINFSEKFKNYLRRISGLLKDSEVKEDGYNIYLTEKEEVYYQSLIANINYQISESDEDVRRLVDFFRGRCNYPTIPTIKNLEQMRNISNYTNTVGIESIDGHDEEDISIYIKKFISSIMYTYDSTTNDYIKVNGAYKINERNLCDLAMFLSSYEEYITNYENIYSPEVASPTQTSNNYTDEDEEYDQEEFLEESDFARNNTSSEEQGYHLHYGDGYNKW